MKQKDLYEDFRDIPKSWQIVKLGDLGTFLKGKGISKSDVIETGFPCVRYGELYTVHDYVIREFHSHISKESASKSCEIREGDLLFAGSGETAEEIGKAVAYIGNKTAYAGGDVIILRTKDTNNVYLSYALNIHSVAKQKWRYGQGISVVHIYSSSLKDILLPLPPIAEQEKIAELLSTWHTGVVMLEKCITAKKEQMNGLTRQLLTDKRQFPEFSTCQWNKRPLTEFLVPNIRPVPKPGNPFHSLGIRCHGKGIFHKPNFEPDSIALDELYEVKANDLIVNITFAWEGAIAVAAEDDDGALVSHRFPTFQFNTDVMLPEYFKYVILQKRFVYDLGVVSPGGAGRNRVLNKKDFLKIKVDVPGLEEQTKIASVLNTCNREIEQLKAQAEALKKQKRGLMQKLLTGKLRVKGVNNG